MAHSVFVEFSNHHGGHDQHIACYEWAKANCPSFEDPDIVFRTWEEVERLHREAGVGFITTTGIEEFRFGDKKEAALFKLFWA